MRNILHLATDARETLVDIAEQVRAVVKASGVRNGLASVYAQGATAARACGCTMLRTGTAMPCVPR